MEDGLMYAIAPLIAAGLIAAGSAVIQSVMQNRANSEMQDKQNAYNSPVEQMARYQAAGLNPNLIYGSGGNAGNQASPVQFEVPNVAHHIGRYAETRLQSKQLELMDQQTRKNEADISLSYAKAYNSELDGAVKRMNQLAAQANDSYNLLAKYNVQAKQQQLRNLIADFDLKKASALNLEQDRKIKDEVVREKQHYNTLRMLGVEKNDNIFLRGGMSLFQPGGIGQQSIRWIDKHIRK